MVVHALRQPRHHGAPSIGIPVYVAAAFGIGRLRMAQFNHGWTQMNTDAGDFKNTTLKTALTRIQRRIDPLKRCKSINFTSKHNSAEWKSLDGIEAA
jgi:hypothetical protein